MVFWVFGYGSLVWNPGFDYDEKIIGFIKDYRRVFDLGKSRAGETILAQLPQFLRHGILNYFCSVHWSPGNAWKPSENLHIGGERRGYLRKCIYWKILCFLKYQINWLSKIGGHVSPSLTIIPCENPLFSWNLNRPINFLITIHFLPQIVVVVIKPRFCPCICWVVINIQCWVVIIQI